MRAPVDFSTPSLDRTTKPILCHLRSHMQIHRLLSKDHSESLLRGSFRFGRLRYYQMLEVVFEDESIGDAQEGSVSSVLSASITPDHVDDPVRTNLERSGFITVKGNASVEIRDATFTNEVDCFVCCWSTSTAPDLSGTGSAYDTCVTAAGAKSLTHYLNKFGVERESGSKILELFDPIESRRVQYHDSAHNMATGPLPSGNPFRKRSRYRHQAEYRLVLIPRAKIAADFVYIDCHQAAELLSSTPVGRSQTAAFTATDKPAGASYYEQLLAAILEEWRQCQDALATKNDLPLATHQATNGSGFDAIAAWRADCEAWQARRNAALAEFDRVHLKSLRRCLFELRTAPFNEHLDRALAHGASSDRLIRLYEYQWRGLPHRT